MNLEFKTEPRLLAFAGLLVIVVSALVMHGDITAKEALAFLGGALALPGLFGANGKDDDNAPPSDPTATNPVTP